VISVDQLNALMAAYPLLQAMPADLKPRVQKESLPVLASVGAEVRPLGAVCDSLPMVVSGVIRVIRRNDAGRSVVLYRVCPGQVCSMSLTASLAATRFAATAIAEQAISGVCIPSGLLVELISRYDRLRQFLFAGVCDREARLIDLIDDFAFNKVEQRLAKHLLATQPVLLSTHQALAGRAQLKEFEACGYLRLRRGEIVVTDDKALRTRVLRPQAG